MRSVLLGRARQGDEGLVISGFEVVSPSLLISDVQVFRVLVAASETFDYDNWKWKSHRHGVGLAPKNSQWCDENSRRAQEMMLRREI